MLMYFLAKSYATALLVTLAYEISLKRILENKVLYLKVSQTIFICFVCLLQLKISTAKSHLISKYPVYPVLAELILTFLVNLDHAILVFMTLSFAERCLTTDVSK